MPRWIERRNTPEGPRYREWSSILDKYCTPEMIREEMTEYLRYFRAIEPIEERLNRVDKTGTSLLDNSHVRDMNSDWQTERCDGCGRFHHDFKLRESDRLCSGCGEPKDDSGHEVPCSENPARSV